MDAKVEKIEKNVANLKVTVEKEKFQEALVKSYKKNVVKFNVPGFRKGKAPMPIVERYYGESVLYEDAVNYILDETYPEVIKQEDLHPVDYPQFDIAQIGKGKDFIYTAKVVVKPEVKLGQYKGIEAKKVEYPVTDADVDNEISAMREKNSRLIDKQGDKADTVENGDMTVIDFEGFIDGVAFKGGKGTDYELKIGSNTFIPGFEDQLVGAKLNSSVDVNVTFPEDYNEESLKGKPALFKVTVKSIKTKELPKLDDEFAKDVSEFDTLQQLKDDIKKKQIEANEKRAKADYEDGLLKKVVDSSEMDIPDVMVEKEIDYLLRDYDMRLRYQGIDLNKYIELTGTTMDKIRGDFKETALARVKSTLVIDAIAKAEGIKASEDEVKNKVEEISKQYSDKDTEKLKKNLLENQRAVIEDDIIDNKVIDLLVSESKTVEK